MQLSNYDYPCIEGVCYVDPETKDIMYFDGKKLVPLNGKVMEKGAAIAKSHGYAQYSEFVEAALNGKELPVYSVKLLERVNGTDPFADVKVYAVGVGKVKALMFMPAGSMTLISGLTYKIKGRFLDIENRYQKDMGNYPSIAFDPHYVYNDGLWISLYGDHR